MYIYNIYMANYFLFASFKVTCYLPEVLTETE